MATSNQSKTEYYGDQATAEDLLGFREHAERLADEISRFDPNLPMVVGIEGKWGEGKTSFLLMMEAYWRRKNKLAPEWPGLCKGWWLPCHWKALVKSVSGFLFGSQLECEQTQASPTHWLDPSNQLNKMEPVKNSGLIVFKFETLGNWILDLRGKLPREDRKIHLIKFDPWWFSGKEKLLERFLDEIKAKEPFYALLAKGMLSGLKGGFDKHNRYWLKIFSSAVVVAFASSRFTDLALLISREVTVPTKDELQTSIEIVSILSAVLAILFFMLIGGVVEKLLNFILPTDMEKKRVRLERKLRRSPVQRIVIVDDIDRLPDDELQELFRVIKSVAAMPNIVYVLLYDREAVAGALDKLHANRGEQFLEKIVQLSSRLPIPTKTSNQTAAYLILSSLPLIKNLLSQTPIKEEVQEGLRLIVGSLIPNLRQAKRIANMVKISYKKHNEKDDGLDVLLFVFLDALRLHSIEIWAKLCSAMTDYKNYPNGAEIRLGLRHEETETHLSSKENEWMIKHGLMSEGYEPCPPFSRMPEKLIECIAYFTGLALPGAKKACSRQLFYIPKSVETDDQRMYCQDLFEKYLQAKLDEGTLSVECIREELLTLNSVTDVTQFINDKKSKFGEFIISPYYIKAYLRDLKTEECKSEMANLYKLPGLVAESAEYCYLSQANLESQADFIRDCEIIFYEFLSLRRVRESIDPKDLLDQLVEKEKQLLRVTEKECPLFHFKLTLGLKSTPPDDPIYQKEKQAVLDKYSPQTALQILFSKDKGLGGKIFEKILLDTCTDAEEERFSNWLCSSQNNSELDVLLLDWMIASLEKERDNSRLPLLPELAHLIEPLKRELESKGDDVALENLKAILERNSSKTNP